MEIHHTPKRHRQLKIKELIFEFLMMFLAITGGFFMENLREEHIERRKEHEYIERLVKDVAGDTISVRQIITICESQMKGIDSLKMVLKSPASKVDYPRMYHLTMTYLNKLISFSPDQITMTQLKNSGGLRLISNKSASDSIVNYYSTYDSHMGQQNYIWKFLQETLNMEILAMDFSALDVGGSAKFSFEKKNFQEFHNRTLLFQSLLENEMRWMKEYQKQSISLLKHLKREYELET